jgi:hypothetical protein
MATITRWQSLKSKDGECFHEGNDLLEEYKER